jgi:diguanylate cyclase (GGDEF)-like protein
MSAANPLRQLSRRAADGGPLAQWLHRIVRWAGHQWTAVAAGRLMLLVTGVFTVLTMPLLDPLARLWTVLLPVGGIMGVPLAVSFLVPWARLSRHATLAFPVLVWLALATLGIATDGAAAPYTGLFVLCFAYIGLTEPTGIGIRVLPLGAAGYVAANGSWTGAIGARLIIELFVWALLSELLADLMARQRVMTDQLHQAAHTDALTSLPNRRDLELRIARAAPGDSIVICDLDHFKDVNDTLGHAAGDRVLADFGLVLRSCLRATDYAARYGGEEFALLLPGTDEAQTAIMLHRLRERWAVLQPGVTFSSGTATCARHRPLAETVAAADRCLYAAKAAGRDRDHCEHGILERDEQSQPTR